MSKPRPKDQGQTKQTGRIVLIRDGRLLGRRQRGKTTRLAACGGSEPRQ